MPSTPLTVTQRRFLEKQRVGHLATADAAGAPQVVPVCFALGIDSLYITIDDKPKRRDRPLKRLRNITENPQVCFIADRYHDSDWSQLGWVMLRGRAEILQDGAEHVEAQRLLRARYAQYAEMPLEQHPVIAIRMAQVSSWGRLDEDGT